MLTKNIYIYIYTHVHPLSVHMYVCLFAAKAPAARHRSTLVYGTIDKLRIPILPRETNLGPRLRSTKCDEVRRSLDGHLHWAAAKKRGRPTRPAGNPGFTIPTLLVDPLCLAARSMHVLPNLSFAPWCRLGKPNPYSFSGESRAEPAPRIPHPFPKSSARTSRAKERLRNVHAWNTVYCCWSGRLHIPWTRCQISFHTPLLYYLLAKNTSWHKQISKHMAFIFLE